MKVSNKITDHKSYSTRVELTKQQTKKLEVAGFEGIDIDMDISLFEYGQLSTISENEILVLYARSMMINQSHYHFDYTRIDTNELLDDLENMENGFFDFVGENKEGYINQLRINPYNSWIVNRIIFDINQYNGLYKESCSWDYINIEELINRLI